MGIALGGISQTSNDTICLPASQLKLAINKIEKAKVVEEELILTQKALEVSEKRIKVKDSIITLFEVKEESYKSIIEGYKKNIANSEQVVANLEKSLTLEKKRVRRQKFNKWVIALCGIGFGFLISK